MRPFIARIPNLALLNKALSKLGLHEIRPGKGLDIPKPLPLVFYNETYTHDNAYQAINRTKRDPVEIKVLDII